MGFFSLTYALSWSWLIPLAAAHLVVQRGTSWPTHLPALLEPAIAALVVTAQTMGRPGMRDLGARAARWRVPLRWWLVAVSPVVFAGLALTAMAAAGKALPRAGDFGRFSGIPAIGLAGMLLIIFIGTLGEETGWRGFALPHLQRLLGLPIGDAGFDHTVLAEFRGKVADAGAGAGGAGRAAGQAGGKQRTDSTHVVAAVAALNRLELVGESVQAALEALTAAHPAWVAQRICVPDFARRYGTPMTSWRPPASQSRRDELAIAYARDGYAMLEAVYDKTAPAWLRELPAVDVLRRVLVQNYTRTITQGGREVIKRREKEPEGDGLPPGHARIASPYDPDARWGVKREEFWLGYKLHVTETCDDPPPCTCRPDPAAPQPAASGADHDRGCARQVFPNLITSVATTDATVTDNQMTADDARAGFTIDHDRKTVTCPQGKTSATWTRAPSEARTRSWPPSPPATADPGRPAPSAPPTASTSGSSPCRPATWPKPRPPPAPRKP